MAPEFDQHDTDIVAAQAIHRRFEQGCIILGAYDDQRRRIDPQLHQPRRIDAAACAAGAVVAQPQDRLGRGIGEQREGDGAGGVVSFGGEFMQRGLGERRGDTRARVVRTWNFDKRGRSWSRRRRQRKNHSSWFVLV